MIDALKRAKATPQQVGLSQAARAQNVQGAFRVATRSEVEGRRLLLVDDVLTSGATVDACARSYVTDPDTYESAEQSPFVVAGQGPWGPQFKAALRKVLEVTAGSGD